MDDVGVEVINNVFDELKVDVEWSLKFDRGFEWWAHNLKQMMWVTEGINDNGIHIYSIYVKTDILRNISVSLNDVEKMLGAIGTMACGASLIYDPNNNTLDSWSSFIVHKDNSEWMTRLIVSFAILQIEEAERVSDLMSASLKGDIAKSSNPFSEPRKEPDEMLSVVSSLFVPRGQEKSPWNDCDELIEIQKMFNDGNCFATGDKSSLTAEFPFNNETSMMRVITTEPHPVLGSGIGMFLHLPIRSTVENCSSIASQLNNAELNKSEMFHFMGSWCVKELGEYSVPAFAFFIPSLLYQPGLLTNLILPMVQRAFWASDMVRKT